MKKLSIVFTLLIASACNAPMAEDKTEFNLAVEKCVSQTRLGDGHTNQDISKCVDKSDGICAEADGFRGPFGEPISIDFEKTSSLTCLKSTEETNEVCDIRTWTNFIPEEDRNPEKGIFAEQPDFNINCLSIDNSWN